MSDDKTFGDDAFVLLFEAAKAAGWQVIEVVTPNGFLASYESVDYGDVEVARELQVVVRSSATDYQGRQRLMSTAIELPGYAVLADAAITTEIAKPGWLYVWRSTELATGLSWLSVYRSVHITDERPMFQPARELIGDAELLHRETTRDEQMMGYQAELSIYGVAA